MSNIELRELTGNIAMYPLIRTGEELFSSTVLNAYNEIIKQLTDPKTKKIKKADVFIINASWYDVSYAGYIDAMKGGDPVSANETTNLGLIYKNGTITSGKSARDGYFISFMRDMIFKNLDLRMAFKMGMGDPPSKDKPTAAFGDVGPLIINDLPYGSINLYQKDADKKAPLTGEPPSEFRTDLIQRSSKKFSQFDVKDKSDGYTKGKTCIGVSSSKLIIGVQKDGIKGPSLGGIRDYFLKQKCRYAAFFDGSDSAMLFENGKFTISMGNDKNELCTAGILFIKYY